MEIITICTAHINSKAILTKICSRMGWMPEENADHEITVTIPDEDAILFDFIFNEFR